MNLIKRMYVFVLHLYSQETGTIWECSHKSFVVGTRDITNPLNILPHNEDN